MKDWWGGWCMGIRMYVHSCCRHFCTLLRELTLITCNQRNSAIKRCHPDLEHSTAVMQSRTLSANKIFSLHSIPAKYQSTILFTLKSLFYQKWKIDLIKIIILRHITKLVLFCMLYFERYSFISLWSQLVINAQ